MLERMVEANPKLAPSIFPILYPDDDEITKALENWDPGDAAAPGAPAGEALPAEDAGGLPSGFQPPPLADGGVALTSLDPSIITGLLAASHVSVDRALEKAANRLISHLTGIDKSYADRLRRERRTEVLSIAGTEWVSRAGLGTDDLFHQCWDQLSVEAVGWLRAALVERGEDSYTATQVAEVAAAELATQLTNLCSKATRRRLAVGANGYKVPTELVLSALTAGDLARTSRV